MRRGTRFVQGRVVIESNDLDGLPLRVTHSELLDAGEGEHVEVHSVHRVGEAHETVLRWVGS